jgi:glycosyltransferase involved in cell wall biosynthesis
MYEFGINFDSCQDDASNSSLNALNEHVNELSNCSFVSLKENLAHRANRNSRHVKAKFDYLLFIDGDSIIIHDKFIKNTLILFEDFDVVYGRLHPEKCPSNHQNYVGNTEIY